MSVPTLDYASRRKQFDPDEYRMTIGEHLEELRRRLILALAGLAIAFVGCLIFAQTVIAAFCKPLLDVLRAYEVNPQIYFTQVSEPFMVYIKISLISAAVIASPWMIWQLWLFVAAGLYPHERKLVTKYVPLSIALLIAGVLFVYYLVLPWTLQFFLAFSIQIRMPTSYEPSQQPASTQPSKIEVFDGDPKDPVEGQIWINKLDGRLKLFLGEQVRVLAFGPQNLTAPIITLTDYINLVFGMLLTFGLSFQLPLVVMALVAAGIVEREALIGSRRFVYFGMAIVAAVITPGDVITATLALMVPLCALFELGVWLSRPPKTTMEPGS